MTQIIRTQHPHEILQLAPIIAGGTPTDSALFLLFCGRRTASALRADLPTRDDDADAWAISMLDAVASVGADGVVVILYPGDEIGAGPLPYSHLAAALERFSHGHEIELRDTFIVGTDYWGDYRRQEGPMAPAIEISELDARFDGLPTAGALGAGAAGMPEELSGKAAEEQRALVDSLVEDEEPVDAVVIASKALADGPDALDDVTAAKLSTLTQLAITREQILTALVSGASEAQHLGHDSCCNGPVDEAIVRERTSRILIGEAKGVSLSRLQRSLKLWQAVAQRTIPEQLAPVLGILGWLHWATGMRSVAAACAERAIELDSSFSLPHSVLQLTDSGHMPSWYSERVRRPIESQP